MDFSEQEEAVVLYAISVLKLNTDVSVIPKGLLEDSHSEENQPIIQFLRQHFTPFHRVQRHGRSLRAVVQGVRFAVRLMHLSQKRLPVDRLLPYKTGEGSQRRIQDVLGNVQDWCWDVFELQEVTEGRALQTLAWHLFHSWGLVEKFHFDEKVLQNFLQFVESSYNDNDFHNSTHAADVLQSVHYMLATAGLHRFVSDLELVSLLLAAMIHDVGHDGMNNDFHKAVVSDRALQYNNQSIQENFHSSAVFMRLWHDEEINLLQHLSSDQQQVIRSLVIHMVLGTDMSKHFSELKEFRSCLHHNGSSPDAWSESIEPLLCWVLHACDISNPARPNHLAVRWTMKCMEEFYKQGDKEKEGGMPVSPLCDRATTLIPLAQVRFIDFIVAPTFQELAEVLPDVQFTCVARIKQNRKHWMDQIPPELAAPLHRACSTDSAAS
eukprot:CAMPEP_0181347584 /NCGR_PEP_ID=MMETSP1101-20121128/33957_1 /TAXON_ID=46948 /ORGANISM="Rhodomonas abbreviata, Strain Caron Lab Isolate" /LENGTH=435 /DNA_ID=CAMNT_0023459809 /DNA_START=408 /DNA_END=1715 /DNA_ORIENTATION=-